ncbi:MAG: ankyrin repeat domain-containing protein [Planctomycetota bacterium]|jgi:ankyrin repeat protein
MKRIISLFLLFSIFPAAGCAYMKDRGNDFIDIFTCKVGYGGPFSASVNAFGALHASAGVSWERLYGYEGRNFVADNSGCIGLPLVNIGAPIFGILTWGDSWFGEHSEEMVFFGPFSTGFRWHEKEMKGEDCDYSYFGVAGLNGCMFFDEMSGRNKGIPWSSRYCDITVTVCAGFALELGISPYELADFFLGWLGEDISNDDNVEINSLVEDLKSDDGKTRVEALKKLLRTGGRANVALLEHFPDGGKAAEYIVSEWKDRDHWIKPLEFWGLFGASPPDPEIVTVAKNNWTRIMELFIDWGVNVNVNGERYRSMTPLHHAVENDNMEMVKMLVEAGADIEAEDDWDSQTPLVTAAEKGRVEIARFLYRQGADPFRKGKSHWENAISAAASREHQNVIRMFIEEGIDLNRTDSYGRSIIHLASGDEELLERLAKTKGLDINTPMKSGRTILHGTVRHDYYNVEKVKLLLALGADVNVKDEKGITPLHDSAGAVGGVLAPKVREVATLLIDNGADVNAKADDGKTPLHFASEGYAHYGMVKLLVENGADVNAKTDIGLTALHFLANAGGYINNNAKAVMYLAVNGADINARDKNNRTPLLICVKQHSGTLLMVEVFIKAGADINVKDKDGNTPIHIAARGYPEKKVLELLVKNGPDINSKNTAGETPLHKAARYYDETSKMLIDMGADVNAKNADGNTPLDIALKIDYQDRRKKVVSVIRTAGGKRGDELK